MIDTVAPILFYLCALGCALYLWYDRRPAVRTRRALLWLLQDREEAKQEIQAEIRAAKARMERIKRSRT